MKKLLAGSFLFLLVALSIATASPAPLLLQWARPQTMLLGLTDPDVSAITSFAANNQAQLIASLINGMDIATDVMVLPNVKNKVPMPKLKIADGARPYNSKQEFKPGNLKYTDRFLEVQIGKRELQIDVEAYRATYLAWSTSPGSPAGKKEIPFEQFVWAQVLKAYQRELNDETTYKGFDGSTTAAFNAGTVYNAGDKVTYVSTNTTTNPNGVSDWWLCLATTTAGQTPDSTPAKWQNVSARAIAPGLESYLLTEIAGSTITPVSVGAITSTAGQAIAGFKKMFRAFTPAYRNNGIIISASYTDFDFLMDDLSDKYKAVKDNVQVNGFLVLPDTGNKCIVKPATWLGTSRRLIAGPVMGQEARHMNLWMGTDLLSDKDQISIKDNELWNLNAGIKSRIGFQIQDLNGIRVGDQA